MFRKATVLAGVLAVAAAGFAMQPAAASTVFVDYQSQSWQPTPDCGATVGWKQQPYALTATQVDLSGSVACSSAQQSIYIGLTLVDKTAGGAVVLARDVYPQNGPTWAWLPVSYGSLRAGHHYTLVGSVSVAGYSGPSGPNACPFDPSSPFGHPDNFTCGVALDFVTVSGVQISDGVVHVAPYTTSYQAVVNGQPCNFDVSAVPGDPATVYFEGEQTCPGATFMKGNIAAYQDPGESIPLSTGAAYGTPGTPATQRSIATSPAAVGPGNTATFHTYTSFAPSSSATTVPPQCTISTHEGDGSLVLVCEFTVTARHA